MPIKCFNKPNRSQRRFWTAKTAAQAVCYAVAAGASPEEIRQEMAPCVPCETTRRRSNAAQQALAAMARTNAVLDLFATVAQALQRTTRGLQFISRFVPQARVAGLALIPVERALGVVGTDIRVARAANDAAMTALRLAA